MANDAKVQTLQALLQRGASKVESMKVAGQCNAGYTEELKILERSRQRTLFAGGCAALGVVTMLFGFRRTRLGKALADNRLYFLRLGLPVIAAGATYQFEITMQLTYTSKCDKSLLCEEACPYILEHPKPYLETKRKSFY